MFIFNIFIVCKAFFMCIYYIKKESWGVLVCLGVSSGILGRPGVIRLTDLLSVFLNAFNLSLH